MASKQPAPAYSDTGIIACSSQPGGSGRRRWRGSKPLSFGSLATRAHCWLGLAALPHPGMRRFGSSPLSSTLRSAVAHRRATTSQSQFPACLSGNSHFRSTQPAFPWLKGLSYRTPSSSLPVWKSAEAWRGKAVTRLEMVEARRREPRRGLQRRGVIRRWRLRKHGLLHVANELARVRDCKRDNLTQSPRPWRQLVVSPLASLATSSLPHLGAHTVAEIGHAVCRAGETCTARTYTSVWHIHPSLQYANVTMRSPVLRAKRLIGVIVQR